jgi:Zn-dependent protease with chaperone function
MSKTWKALYFDGRTPTHRNVDVQTDRQGVRIEFEAGTTRIWRYEDFSVRQDRSQGPLRLEYGEFPPEILEIADPEFGEVLGKRLPKKSLFLSVGFAMLAVLLVPAIIYWGIPLASGWFAYFIPVSIEKQVGQYVIDEVFPSRIVCKTDAGEQALEKLVSRLVPPDSAYVFQVEVVDSGLVNAIAFPGGNILIFRGLLEKSPSADAVAGVLAHEMQHVFQRHGTENLLNQVALSGLFKLLTVEANAIAETLFAGVRTLSLLKYTRELETEADALALQLLYQAGVDPVEMLAMFQVLKNHSSSLPESISTHPDMSSRMEKLKIIIDQKPDFVSKPVLSKQNWESLQNICKN